MSYLQSAVGGVHNAVHQVHPGCCQSPPAQELTASLYHVIIGSNLLHQMKASELGVDQVYGNTVFEHGMVAASP